MIYKYVYKTPKKFDNILMISDGIYLTGLRFENSESSFIPRSLTKKLSIFEETRKWLDIYFSGNIPNFTPKYKISNLTDFRKDVIEIVKKIPYSEVITYKDIAMKIKTKKNIEKMSFQAVGNAVGWNPICIIIPCHRVIGTNKSLTGYSGGIKNKKALLELEGDNLNN